MKKLLLMLTLILIPEAVFALGGGGGIHRQGSNAEFISYTSTARLTEADFASYTSSVTSEAYILLRDEKPQTTDGGTFTAGAWRTRVLNSEYDSDGFANISSNSQVVLQSGTYRTRACAPAFYVDRHKIRLYNITDAAVQQIIGGGELSGTSEYSLVGGAGQTSSCLAGRFTIASEKILELQHRAETTRVNNGFGVKSNLGIEIYSYIEFWREF